MMKWLKVVKWLRQLFLIDKDPVLEKLKQDNERLERELEILHDFIMKEVTEIRENINRR